MKKSLLYTETIDEILKDISVLQDELTTFDIPSIVYESINKQLDRIYEKLEKHTNIEQEQEQQVKLRKARK